MRDTDFMAQIFEHLASQIDGFADGLLLMAALAVQLQARHTREVVWLWSFLEGLGQQLRDQVRISQTWERRAAAEGWDDQPGLEAAFCRLQRSSSRAALFLGRVDVIVATTGAATQAIEDEA